jgi:hypothetical protein
MDEAFMPLHAILDGMLAQLGEELVDEQAGVRSHIVECSIETPVELDLVRDDTGALRLGATPPLYRVETSFQPSFHRISFTATLG